MKNLFAVEREYQAVRQAESFQGGQIPDLCQAAAAMLQILAHDPLHRPLPRSAAQPSSTSSSTHAADRPAWPTPSPREWQNISTTAIRAAATAYWLQLKIQPGVELNVQCKLMQTLLRLLAVLLSGMLLICFVVFRLVICRVSPCLLLSITAKCCVPVSCVLVCCASSCAVEHCCQLSYSFKTCMHVAMMHVAGSS